MRGTQMSSLFLKLLCAHHDFVLECFLLACVFILVLVVFREYSTCCRMLVPITWPPLWVSISKRKTVLFSLLQLQEILSKNGLKLDSVIEFAIEDDLLVKRITGRYVLWSWLTSYLGSCSYGGWKSLGMRLGQCIQAPNESLGSLVPRLSPQAWVWG